LVHLLIHSVIYLFAYSLRFAQDYVLLVTLAPVKFMLKVHGHGQTHSRNFCRFKLDI